ncbi:hypothetical protein N7U66_09985 [Lacinutrix neustonica]|uniref:Uncharacterized protein n=1 Tax=Lacinutrix neustonica TaxID=2980107 RepID=A0A9E8N0N8_9FLAO|nr:hypothetical protein [Lacinutrix neustonica]WAC03719.1 hypothetical protein N7U66_09985 [Lacinutrix neustonica]
MKKIIHTVTLLCITTMVYSQEQKEANNTAIDGVSTFGRLGSDCSGRGICSFTTSTNKSQPNTRLIYNEDNTVTFFIDRTKITTEDVYKIIGGKITEHSKGDAFTFILEASLELDSSMLSKLEITLPITTILKGNYPVAITNESFIMTLKIQ